MNIGIYALQSGIYMGKKKDAQKLYSKKNIMPTYIVPSLKDTELVNGLYHGTFTSTDNSVKGRIILNKLPPGND